MLIEFSFSNIRSFKSEKTLNMVASTFKEHQSTHTFTVSPPKGSRAKPITLLKSAAIYGANASGKSNVIAALSFIKRMVLISATKLAPSSNIPINKHLLNAKCQNEPSSFELIFFADGIRYRYGAEFYNDEIGSEWLYHAPNWKEAKLFIRNGQKFDIGSAFKEGKGLEEKTRQNSLFLSVCAQFNGKITTSIYNWFKTNLKIISGLDDSGYANFTLRNMEEDSFKKEVLEFIKIADLGIEDILIEKMDTDAQELPSELKKKLKELYDKTVAKAPPNAKVKAEINLVSSLHKGYDRGQIREVFFPFGFESEGTQKFFAMSGLIIDSIKRGSTIIIDEMDSRLHPLLSKFLVELFNSLDSNPNNAQLIFATHDTNLLKASIFRRDQIWFTEKDKQGASDLYSLADYKVRADASFQKDYILGKYGAIPFISSSNYFIGRRPNE